MYPNDYYHSTKRKRVKRKQVKKKVGGKVITEKRSYQKREISFSLARIWETEEREKEKAQFRESTKKSNALNIYRYPLNFQPKQKKKKSTEADIDKRGNANLVGFGFVAGRTREGSDLYERKRETLWQRTVSVQFQLKVCLSLNPISLLRMLLIT